MVPRAHEPPVFGARLRAAFGVAVLASGFGFFTGCKRSTKETPAPTPSGALIAPEVVSRVVNPRAEQAYSGPTGTIRGFVRATGDTAPEQPEVLRQIPDGCERAREIYGKLFREGPGRSLADVLVAVTGYKGYVPASAEAVEVQAMGCAFSTRTVAATFGQRIDVVAKDRRAYIPELLGARTGVQLIALPGGAGSALYPRSPGRYVLVDSMRIFATAEVLVLKYATFAVTGLDGTFVIRGVPIGPVTVNAALPATLTSVERKIVVESDKETQLQLELPFDAKSFSARSQPNPAPSAPPPGSPSGSAPVDQSTNGKSR